MEFQPNLFQAIKFTFIKVYYDFDRIFKIKSNYYHKSGTGNETFTYDGFTTPINIGNPSFGQPSGPINPQINGRLLTPAEGCGFSPARQSRVVGGSPAINGKHANSISLLQRKILHLCLLHLKITNLANSRWMEMDGIARI